MKLLPMYNVSVIWSVLWKSSAILLFAASQTHILCFPEPY